jgi:hypothetical protein
MVLVNLTCEQRKWILTGLNNCTALQTDLLEIVCGPVMLSQLVFQISPCSHFTLFHQPQIYHVSL